MRSVKAGVNTLAEASPASTGFSVLDEKLGWFFKRGRNFLVVGAPMSGKKLFSRRFLYQGLLQDEAGVLTCASNSAEKEKQSFAELGMDTSKFEEEGLLVYVDFYSKTVGLPCSESSYIKYVSSLMDLPGYNVIIRDLTTQFWRREKPLRLVFDSISTLLLYNEVKTVVRFLHVLFGRLRSVGAISLILVEEGSHPAEAMASLASIADGILETKAEEGKYYLRARSELGGLEWTAYHV
ncbi:MAG: hypothetical protein DRO52_02330 [Candidatus Hecatellales archaeon]|nr:MAG: hypothetical protein DRO52_02330 [Candidatus Hecatellales archaeon]